jgi:hypothetical protein
VNIKYELFLYFHNFFYFTDTLIKFSLRLANLISKIFGLEHIIANLKLIKSEIKESRNTSVHKSPNWPLLGLMCWFPVFAKSNQLINAVTTGPVPH